jgi:hypothetical protein
VLVAISGGVLAIIGSSAAQPRTLISRRLSPVTLSRSRLTPLSRALPILRGMTTVPSALIELRRFRIRFDAQFALGANRHSVVALVARGVRSSARVFISLGQIRSGRTAARDLCCSVELPAAYQRYPQEKEPLSSQVRDL